MTQNRVKIAARGHGRVSGTDFLLTSRMPTCAQPARLSRDRRSSAEIMRRMCPVAGAYDGLAGWGKPYPSVSSCDARPLFTAPAAWRKPFAIWLSVVSAAAARIAAARPCCNSRASAEFGASVDAAAATKTDDTSFAISVSSSPLEGASFNVTIRARSSASQSVGLVSQTAPIDAVWANVGAVEAKIIGSAPTKKRAKNLFTGYSRYLLNSILLFHIHGLQTRTPLFRRAPRPVRPVVLT